MVGPYRRRLGRALAVLAAAVALAAGCRGPAQPTLSDLHGVADLQARFNRDAGKTRLVLLLSPT